MKELNNDYCFYTDLYDFVRHHHNDIFRYWIYRRMYTPFEQEKKYSDEDYYEDSYCTYAYIRELIELPYGDYLIGFLDSDSAAEGEKKDIQYCKLSEIRLELYEGDQ